MPGWITLAEGAKCALLSMDSTMKSNISVSLLIDLIYYERDSLKVAKRHYIDGNDAYFNTIRKMWGDGLTQIFGNLPDIDWSTWNR